MKLIVKKIKNEKDFSQYLDLVESFDVINPFYKIIGADLKELIDEKLRYFRFEDDNEEVLVLMPFLLRKTPDVGLEETYYDVISPYGYSGPLFNYNLSRGYLIKFWEFVDDWYRKNNVVSEFIRFSLNSNHQFYSGILIPTLANVKGVILEADDQWNNFKQKVRNNYRKAVASNLRIDIVQDYTDLEKIKIFHDIYIQTMTRINADKQYFYSFNYFKKTVALSKHNFLIALVYYGDVAISTELILISGNTLFSYLGGTLSEYFNYRPNDFLKIEVMNWARKQGFKYYILGGGREDGDNLYQYKKTFFPNDTDVIFFTGRKVVNKSIYDTLNTILNIEVKTKTDKTVFFPPYRNKNSM